MRIAYRKKARANVSKRLLTVFLGLAVLATSGCEEPGAGDGVVINDILLPTDVVLNLFCADVGINDELCVLDDPENPFVTTTILEPDQLDEDDPDPPPTKFDLDASLPPGPMGAKARFYLWATALARRQNGENQWKTASALHELFTYNSNEAFEDTLIKEHAKRAYRSVLDNFFGQATFFAFGGLLVPAQLNEIVARSIVFPDETGLRPLVDTSGKGLELLGEWGYTYDAENDRLSINE